MMRAIMGVVAGLFVLGALPGAQGQAAEIRYLGQRANIYSPYNPVDKTHVWVLSGPINGGDVETLKGEFAKQTQRSVFCEVESPAVIVLDSPGGNFSEGLKFAKLFRDFGVGTLVSSGGQCLSACAVAFLGGTRHLCLDGDKQKYRRIAPGARLGFHAPKLVVPDLDYTKDVVENSYETAVKQLGSLVDEVLQAGIAPSLVVEMLKVGTQSFYDIDTVGKAGRWGIGVALPDPRKLTPEQVKSACANAHAWRNDGFEPNVDFARVRFAPDHVDPAAGRLKRAFVEGEGMYAVTCFLEMGRWPNGRNRYWLKILDDSVVSLEQFYAKRRMEAADVSLTPLYFFPQETKLSDLVPEND